MAREGAIDLAPVCDLTVEGSGKPWGLLRPRIGFHLVGDVLLNFLEILHVVHRDVYHPDFAKMLPEDFHLVVGEIYFELSRHVSTNDNRPCIHYWCICCNGAYGI